MNVLKTPYLFRPNSRPASPAPGQHVRTDSSTALDRSPRKHSLSTFRRSSLSSVPIASATPVVQDGSYLEKLGLKLNEAVSKSLCHPTSPPSADAQLAGKQPIPQGRGKTLGALIESELNATDGNPHLRRATLRCLQRPLSVLVTNLSAHLHQLLSSSEFHVSPTTANPNATQLHALGLASFSGELLERFDELGLGTDGETRGDGLKGIREGLVSVINRVINPLLGGIRNELVSLIDALENPINTTAKSQATIKYPYQHPTIVTLHAVVPVYARLLSRYTVTPTAQTLLASLFITLVWRGLVTLSHRPIHPITTLPSTPIISKFAIRNPLSRPSSPLSLQPPSTAASDARALHDLLNLLPRPAAELETTRLAREAVNEAFEGLRAFSTYLEAVQSFMVIDATNEKRGKDEIVRDLVDLSAELPTLIALPPLLRAFAPKAPSVASMLGLSEGKYRDTCLAGFGKAEECAEAVGLRVFDVLLADSTGVVVDWLKVELDIDD